MFLRNRSPRTPCIINCCEPAATSKRRPDLLLKQAVLELVILRSDDLRAGGVPSDGGARAGVDAIVIADPAEQ